MDATIMITKIKFLQLVKTVILKKTDKHDLVTIQGENT